ncbi:hypothetical protein ABE41_002340 [Fictibacillus arsenicus]|uniref:Uncharacterized protein n=1 Tax=Fictibacillus arsenicus TaxID=255247 RepID=A0A1B1Z0B9_9BACL|nr:hypothetical protein ABE41_002340 [Fictibacillus arsenicus]
MHLYLKLFSKRLLLMDVFSPHLQVDWSARCETPTGRVVRWRLLMAQSGRRLTARPVESEQPGAEINYFQKQQCLRKQLL